MLTRSGAVINWKDPKPAPGRLAVVQDFINTANRMHDRDELQTAARASEALVVLGLIDGGGQIDEAGRQHIVAFREALRQMILTHHEDGLNVTAAAGELNEAIGNVPMRARFSPQGQPTMHPPVGGPPAHQVIGAVLAAIVAADACGEWPRLKACQNTACQWAFYDASRNRSGRWCDMNICGVRHKMRTYRERQR
jgi:predicted RNA-binding Zn ribbon-like protein